MFSKLLVSSRNKSVSKYLHNSGWMLVEHLAKVISGIFVGIYVARYLGPEYFGVLSYSLAMIAVLFGVAKLGMEPIIVRELTLSPEKYSVIMGTALSILLVFSLLSYLALVLLLYSIESYETFLYTSLIGAGIFFQSFLIIAYSFQAKLQAKYSSIAKSIALSLSGGIKIYLELTSSELIWFVYAYALDTVILGLSLFFAHRLLKEPLFIGSFDKSLVKPFLSSSIPMTLAAISYVLYARVDQFMIQALLGFESLGVYSAAIKLYEGWVLLPYLIIMSLLPALVKAEKICRSDFEKKMIYLIALVFWVSAVVFFITYLNSDLIVWLTFGEAFSDSASVLAILIAAGIFTSLGTITARYLNVIKKEKKITWITLSALFINVGLNYWFIPIWGIEGAAYATLLSMFFAFYLYDMFDPDLRHLFRLKNKGILLILTLRFKNEKN